MRTTATCSRWSCWPFFRHTRLPLIWPSSPCHPRLFVSIRVSRPPCARSSCGVVCWCCSRGLGRGGPADEAGAGGTEANNGKVSSRAFFQRFFFCLFVILSCFGPASPSGDCCGVAAPKRVPVGPRRNGESLPAGFPEASRRRNTVLRRSVGRVTITHNGRAPGPPTPLLSGGVG